MDHAFIVRKKDTTCVNVYLGNFKRRFLQRCRFIFLKPKLKTHNLARTFSLAILFNINMVLYFVNNQKKIDLISPEPPDQDVSIRVKVKLMVVLSVNVRVVIMVQNV